MKVETTSLMVLMGLVALLGLYVASGARDVAMLLFGLVLTLSAVSFEFWMIKRHFDATDRHGA